MPGAEQPARCRRPDTGHQEGVSPFALVLSWRVPCSPAWQVQGLSGGRPPTAGHQEAHPVHGIESVTSRPRTLHKKTGGGHPSLSRDREEAAPPFAYRFSLGEKEEMGMHQKRAYKYRCYPTPSQRQMLARTFGCARVLCTTGDCACARMLTASVGNTSSTATPAPP